MSNRAQVIIRINANTDSVFVDGKEFDRSKMTKEERRMTGNRIVGWFERGGK